MGLDMYAYTLKAELADKDHEGKDTSEWVTDFPVARTAKRAVGFITLPDEAIDAMTEEVRSSYWQKGREALDKAKEAGFYDPDFAYWRKFNALHGWMKDLYERLGGTSADFNCNTVRLYPKDLDDLEADAKAKRLAPTQGFFFGSYEEFSDEDQEEVLDFVSKARTAIANGYAVFYDSWW